MMARSDFVGRIADAAAGPVGSKSWVESRARRMAGEVLPLSAAEMEGLRDRLMERVSAGTYRPPQRPILQFNETALGDRGQLEPIADFDDSPQFAPIERAPKISDRITAERIYNSICSDECGVVVDPELFARKQQEKAILRAQSHAIARKLELAKITAYRSSEWSLWVYGIHSGEVEIMPQFRRVAFIPSVAAAIREPFVRSLEFFLQTNLWCRFWTFTNGPRCQLKDLRANIRHLNRRLSRLNSQPFLKDAGVSIVFRSIELGTVEKKRQGGQLDPESGALERDENGTLWFHPHAHCCVVMEKGRLAPPQWAALLKRVWEYWGDHWDDGGTIRSVREAVKYVTKPNEIQHLSPKETRELFEALSRCKLVQPMGRLREEIKAREEAGLTLIRERTEDGFIWRVIPNWNRREPTSAEKHTVTVGGDEDGEPITGEISERDMNAAAKLAACADADACVVVARCTPSACSFGVKEPRVVVMGKRWDLARVQQHPLVERLWLRTYDAWSAGLALIRVHTGTPTVLRKPAFAFMPDLAERVEPPGEPVFS